MSFIEQISEIEAHCSALLTVLYDMGGPYTKFAWYEDSKTISRRG